MSASRRPVHLAVLVGASATVYAVSLAGVTALQSATDARLIAARAPANHAADVLASGHDRLEDSLDEAALAYAAAAGSYRRLAPRIADMEATLDAFGKQVHQVTGAANSLPGRVSLPAIHGSASTRTVTRVVHARTGASGGG